MNKVRLAMFDFDNTIARGDSITTFIAYAQKRGLATRRQTMKTMAAYMKRSFGKATVQEAKETAMAFLKGMEQEKRRRFCQDYFRDVLKGKVYQEAAAELENCRNEGLVPIIVSASVSLYMDELTSILPVDAVICTRAELDGDGRFTGRIGKNCKGAEKPVRIRQYLEENGLQADWEGSRGYGDSRHDICMLETAGEQRLVNPDRELRERFPGAMILNWNRMGIV